VGRGGLYFPTFQRIVHYQGKKKSRTKCLLQEEEKTDATGKQTHVFKTPGT
jgi:hypothetical protein